jgi:hypothetical protein
MTFFLNRSRERPTKTKGENRNLLQTGRVAQLFFLIVICAAVIYFVEAARRGKAPKLRKLPGLDAVEEAVGRATEMARPVVISTGIGGLTDINAPQTVAGLSMVGYVAKLCAKYGARLIAPARQPYVVPVETEIIATAFNEEGKSEEAARAIDMVQYLSDSQFSYTMGYLAILRREQPGAHIMIGAYWAESLQLAEVGFTTGAVQIAGTAMTAQIPFFVAACDYSLIGEEIYAAGAYLSKDPVQSGSIVGQDIGKALAMFLIVAGLILTAVGFSTFVKLLQS